MQKPLTSVLIKPAGELCNLSCNYCFCEHINSSGKQDQNLMSISTLKELMKQICNGPEKNISVVWQGGEPLLMGTDFYREAVNYQKLNSHMNILNCIQTNGLLINREWCRLFEEFNFLVGISLDGPEHVHNRYRTDRKNKGSWKEVIRKLKLLQSYNIAVNLLGVVNSYSVKYPEEIYSFYKSLGFSYFQFIPCLSNEQPYDLKPEEYGNFLIKLFDLWLRDFRNGSPTVFIRFFDAVFYKYAGFESPDCTINSSCGDYLVVMNNGSVYPCDFYISGEMSHGYINESNLRSYLNSDKQCSFAEKKEQLSDECKKCKWLNLCYNGCLKGRVESTSRYALCRSHKMFFEHSETEFLSLAQLWKQSNQ